MFGESEETVAVAEYVGWPAISRRLGVSEATARRWYDDLGLLLFRKNRPSGFPPRSRWSWVLTDELLLAWQIARAKADRQKSVEEREQRRRAGTVRAQADR